ncbi:MAG: hypothetical protein JWN70_6580 [Planctomycetaceae bacterium]|nr:hypothetical protein [Planctomycetaceae bacterium]
MVANARRTTLEAPQAIPLMQLIEIVDSPYSNNGASNEYRFRITNVFGRTDDTSLVIVEL